MINRLMKIIAIKCSNYDVVFRPCVGIVCEPPEEEQWFCKRCQGTPAPTVTKSTGKKKTGGSRGRGRKPGRRRWGHTL